MVCETMEKPLMRHVCFTPQKFLELMRDIEIDWQVILIEDNGITWSGVRNYIRHGIADPDEDFLIIQKLDDPDYVEMLSLELLGQCEFRLECEDAHSSNSWCMIDSDQIRGETCPMFRVFSLGFC